MRILKAMAAEFSWVGVALTVLAAVLAGVSARVVRPEHDLESWQSYLPMLGPFLAGIWFTGSLGLRNGGLPLIVRILFMVVVAPLVPALVTATVYLLLADFHPLVGGSAPSMLISVTCVAGALGAVAGLLQIMAPALAFRDPRALLTGHAGVPKPLSSGGRRTARVLGVLLALVLPATLLFVGGLEMLDLDVREVDISLTFVRAWEIVTTGSGEPGWVLLAGSMILFAVMAVLLLATVVFGRNRPADERG